MKSRIIQDFIANSQGNSKIAFIYKEGLKYKKITFQEFLADIYKMNSYLKEKVPGQNVLIFSFPYNYYFFVAVFSCVFSGKNLVIIDSCGDRAKTKAMLEMAQVSEVLVDNITSKLSFLLPGKLNFHSIKNFKRYLGTDPSFTPSTITTFTSGTTGTPKLINRDLSFLENQIDLIQDNVKIEGNDLVYGLLPMYSLLTVFMNHTCLVSRNIKACEKFGVSMLLAPIKKVQRIKKPLECIKRTFLGGAILYKKETDSILKKLPASEITYVYGASEGAVIYKTTLDKYSKELFIFETPSKGIEVKIANPDKNGIGEITISGKTVIGENNSHNTGDYGKLENGKLILVGRKKYSCSNLDFYNYQYDEYLRQTNSKLKNGFSFYFDGKIHVVYCGKIIKEKGIEYHKFRKLPFDLKHKTKLDYGKVIQKLHLQHKV